MNEIKLSDDLQQIELEIQHHKNIAGQSIWEIGRRLNHVKENDLAHGEFGKWLEKINIDHSTANRFMKVSKELPNSATWQNLGNRALYLIATLPEEEREKEHTLEGGETKTVDEMTVRELQELKRQLKEKDSQLEQAKKSEQIAIEQLEREIINAVVESVLNALETTKQNSMNNERYLQPKQAAIYADVSIQTLNNWVLEFGLPQAKIGGVVLYDTTDLDEFIAKYKL